MILLENFLVCLTGLPASGKSTFAYKLKSILENKFPNYSVSIIDPDVIRKEITPDKFDYKIEQEVRKNNLELVKKTLKEGHIVINDDLNYYTSMRHDLKKMAEDLNIKFIIIHISTPMDICLKWNENRGNPIPNKIIENVNNKFDSFGKYSWDIPFAKFDVSIMNNLDSSIEDLTQKIFQEVRFLKEVKEKKDFKAQQSNLTNEKLDIITRDVVGDLLQNPKFHHLKKKIIKSRKVFVKINLNVPLDELEISKRFRDYLEKRLNINIT